MSACAVERLDDLDALLRAHRQVLDHRVGVHRQRVLLADCSAMRAAARRRSSSASRPSTLVAGAATHRPA